MKFTILTLVFALLAVALAAAPQKAVMVSYPDNTPQYVLDDAKAAIKAAGGIITHEYKLIKAFAAQATAKALDTVQTMGTEFNALIEDDQVVSITGPN